ncbi:acyl-CoA dehydrogenase [Paenibacillus psychroresistens]|uniref:Acyl-CoA dehydrogenase n=1 Tax=Paenibacillus psychroresistens TaxID=1778678 RepID=A0A6B8REK5_9BACL|nr:acyl-CoA dehydrogenase family protein [Paenibacillus psychroresistens]QGQ94600.1 acyl-CoA dehydrogenase [Paenibacillus psychroresistens]
MNELDLFKEEAVAMIRSHAREMEESGLVPQEVLNYMYEHKLFKIYLPEVLGGTMLSLPEALRLIEASSWVDGSFGWLVMIGAGGGFFCSLIPHEHNLKLFANPQAVIAGSGHPSGIAKPVEDGYQVTGQWKFCSGSQYASIFTANCLIETTASATQETPEIRAFIFTPEQVRIIKDWKAFGLKATGSHSMAVDSVFVPHSMTFTYNEPYDNYNNLAFAYPFLQFAEATISAVSIGICRHFIKAAKQFIVALKPSWDKSKIGRFQSVMNQIEAAELGFQSIVADYYRILDASWETLVQRQEISAAELNEASMICKKAAKAALMCGQAIFPILGIQAIMEHAAVNQIWRDLQVVSQHSALAD